MLGLIRSVLGALPDDPAASRHSESVGQSARFESKGRIRGYLAAIPTHIIMLACPTPSAPPRWRTRRLLSRRLLQDRDHAVHDVIDSCPQPETGFVARGLAAKILWNACDSRSFCKPRRLL
jgi:hypothetical protein